MDEKYHPLKKYGSSKRSDKQRQALLALEELLKLTDISMDANIKEAVKLMKAAAYVSKHVLENAINSFTVKWP